MSRFSEAVRNRLTQVLSLSERNLRALFAIAVGASTLLTENLLPETLRGTTIFQVTIGMMQQYIIERVAGMESEVTEGSVELADDYIKRKMTGTALEAAGLLTVGFSPLWVFAIAGDVAGGSKVYLNRLVERLKKNGVMAEDTEAAELVDVLEAIQQATSQSATALDMPPLSREELSALADEMKAGYSRVFEHTADLMPQIDDISERMEQLTNREKTSNEQLSGLMTANAVSLGSKSTDMALAAGQTGAVLFDERILDSYRTTLSAVSERGVDKYVSDHMQPFLQAASSHLDSNRTTWIEKELGGTTNSSE
jgi:hypothetical protein